MSVGRGRTKATRTGTAVGPGTLLRRRRFPGEPAFPGPAAASAGRPPPPRRQKQPLPAGRTMAARRPVPTKRRRGKTPASASLSLRDSGVPARRPTQLRDSLWVPLSPPPRSLRLFPAEPRLHRRHSSPCCLLRPAPARATPPRLHGGWPRTNTRATRRGGGAWRGGAGPRGRKFWCSAGEGVAVPRAFVMAPACVPSGRLATSSCQRGHRVSVSCSRNKPGFCGISQTNTFLFLHEFPITKWAETTQFLLI